MDAAALAVRLAEAFRPYAVPDWEIEERAEDLAGVGEAQQRRVLDLLPAIWPVSHALAFSFLRNAAAGVRVFGETRLQVWVAAILDAYEAGGLDAAQPLVADGGRAFLAELRGEGGARLRAAAPLLQPYLCGLAGRPLEVAEGRQPSTDTAIVWLPRRIAALADPAGNFTLYKLAAAVQWAHIASGTYRAELPPEHPLPGGLAQRHGTAWGGRPAWLLDFFALFPEPALAQRLYHATATVRAAGRVASELPGLARACAPALAELFAQRARPEALGGRARLFEALRRWTWLGEREGTGLDPALRAILAPLRDPAAPPQGAVLAVAGVYAAAAALPEGGAEPELLPFEGVLQPALAEERRRARRAEARELFVEAFRALLAPEAADARGAGGGEPEVGERGDAATPEGGGTATSREGAGRDSAAEPSDPRFVRIGARVIDVPRELQPLVEEIRQDLGDIPASYVSGVLARAGSAMTPAGSPAVPEGPAATEELVYDEWDFRRAGFRRGWCTLRRRELEPGDPAFVARTAQTYRGPLQRIRRAFESMRTAERRLRRQRDGDEIDIDALVEARADSAASLAPSEDLYVRLARDRRDIAAVFLVDMSSSTEGWVNTAIRESLVLLCEALEALGDRYAVYGFSGTRRLHAELYRIKRLDEPYRPEVRARIAAIAPRDYTRMGPPIRHATRLLLETEARTRLLVLLSDGKPEDYDEYKGEYAIEDTRHALLEAKASGVHPFGITLDRDARSYAAHLYGAVSYVVVDDVAKLPLRVPEVYRALTS